MGAGRAHSRTLTTFSIPPLLVGPSQTSVKSTRKPPKDHRSTCTLLRAGITSVRAHRSSNKRGSACLLCRRWSPCLHLYDSIEQKAPPVPPCECGRPHVAGRNSNILLDLPSGLDPNVAWGGEEHGIIPHLRNPKVHQLRYMKPEREVGAIHSRDTYYALGTGEG